MTGKALGNVRTKHRPCLPCPPKSFTIFDSVTPLGPSTRLEKSMGRKAIEFKGAFWGIDNRKQEIPSTWPVK